MLFCLFLFNLLHPGAVLVGPESEFPKKEKKSKKEKKEKKSKKGAEVSLTTVDTNLSDLESQPLTPHHTEQPSAGTSTSTVYAKDWN
jgi:hypothetical protein